MSTKAVVRITAKDETRQAFMSLNRSMQGAQRGISSLVSGFGVLKGAILGLGLVRLGGDIAKAGLSLQRMKTALVSVTGGAEAAAAEFDFVSRVSKGLGLNLESVAGSYVKLTAAAKGTALEGDQTRKIFVAVSEASRALGLSAEQTNGALNAIQQMMSKGKVQAEELRGQLGERLPGAFKLAARAMNVTEAELNKLLETGRVTANDLLPKLANALHDEFGEGAKAAAEGAAASFERFRNNVFLLKAAISDFLLPALQSITDWVNEGALQRLSGAISDVRSVLAIMIGMGIKPFNEQLARSFFELGVEIYDAKKRAEELANGFDRNMNAAEGLYGPIIEVTEGVKGLGEAAKKTTGEVKTFTERLDKVGGTISDMQLKTANERLEEMGGIVDGTTESFFDLKEAILDVQRNIQQGFSDLFFDIFSNKGVDSFKDFANRVLDIFKRLLADMAAAWVASNIFKLPVSFGSGLGGLISGGGIGGGIGQGVGVAGGLGKISSTISGGLGKIVTGLKSIFGGSTATAAGNIGFKGPGAFATSGGGGIGAAGALLPLGIALGGFGIQSSRKDARRQLQNQFFTQVGTGTSDALGESGFDFRGMLNDAEAFFSTTQSGWATTVKALSEAGALTKAWGAQLDENGRQLIKVQGDVGSVKTALSDAAATGFDFAGSLGLAIEKGNNLRVSIQGDSEAIQSALNAATAMGIGGFRDLETTATGVSATLTGNIELWNTYLQGFVNESIRAAINGVDSLGSQAGDATKQFLALASAAAKVRVGATINGGRAAQVDGFANGGVSTSPGLAMVSEGRYRNEAHVPLPDGRTIPVTIKGGVSSASTDKLLGDINRVLRRIERKPAERAI